MTSLPQPYQRQPPKEQQRERLLAALRSLGVKMGRAPWLVNADLTKVQQLWKEKEQ